MGFYMISKFPKILHFHLSFDIKTNCPVLLASGNSLMILKNIISRKFLRKALILSGRVYSGCFKICESECILALFKMHLVPSMHIFN